MPITSVRSKQYTGDPSNDEWSIYIKIKEG